MNKKLILPLGLFLVLAFGAVFYLSNGEDLQGRFGSKSSLSDSPSKPGGMLSDSKFSFPGGDWGTDDETVLLSVQEDVPGATNFDDFQALGSWLVTYDASAEPCHDYFGFRSTGKDSFNFSSDLDDARLYIVTGDLDLESQIANDDYVPYFSLSPLRFNTGLSDLTAGESRFMVLYGDLADEASLTDAKVYLSEACVYDSNYSEYTWSNVNSSDSHFDMDADSNGVYGGVVTQQ